MTEPEEMTPVVPDATPQRYRDWQVLALLLLLVLPLRTWLLYNTEVAAGQCWLHPLRPSI